MMLCTKLLLSLEKRGAAVQLDVLYRRLLCKETGQKVQLPHLRRIDSGFVDYNIAHFYPKQNVCAFDNNHGTGNPNAV